MKKNSALKISIVDGKFKECFDTQRASTIDIAPKSFESNNWKCTIDDGGKIECIAEKKYPNGVSSIRYVLHPDGRSKLTLKLPQHPLEILSKKKDTFKSRKGIPNGTLVLTKGRIEERKAYFIESKPRKDG